MSESIIENIIKGCINVLAIKGNVKALHDLTYCETTDDNWGFCGTMVNILAHYTNEQSRLHIAVVLGFYKQWPEYTGVKNYPIPHKEHAPHYAFSECSFEEMWVEGEYADLRWKFIEDLKEYCENQLK